MFSLYELNNNHNKPKITKLAAIINEFNGAFCTDPTIWPTT